jgi:hypothetical protein
MGAVSGPFLKGLQNVLRCSDRAMQKLGHEVSNTVILGALTLWRAHPQEVAAARPEAEEDASAEEANAMIDEDVSRLPITKLEAELRMMKEENEDNESESNGEQEREMGGELEFSGRAAGMDSPEERRVIEQKSLRNMMTIEIGRHEAGEEENRPPNVGEEETKEERGSGMSVEPAEDENTMEDSV